MKVKPVMIAITNENISYEVFTITADHSGVYLQVIDKESIPLKRVDYWELKLIAYLKGIK